MFINSYITDFKIVKKIFDYFIIINLYECKYNFYSKINNKNNITIIFYFNFFDN